MRRIPAPLKNEVDMKKELIIAAILTLAIFLVIAVLYLFRHPIN